MKKLLSFLAVVGTLTPATVTIVGCNANLIESDPNISGKDERDKNSPNEIKNFPIDVYQLNGFTSLIKIISRKYGGVGNWSNQIMDKLFSSVFPKFYYESINNTQGEVIEWTVIPSCDKKTIKIFEDEFVNEDYNPKEHIIESKVEKLSENYSFSVSLPEKILTNSEVKIDSSIMLPVSLSKILERFSFDFKIGSESEIWSKTKIVDIHELIPSQKIIQSGRTKLYVRYLAHYITYKHQGIVRFKINNPLSKLFRVPIFYFSNKGDFDYIVWKEYSAKDLIQELKSLEYSNQLKMDNVNKYSILSVDNLDNPKDIYVNLPIKWTSESSNLELEHHEEKI